MGVEEKMHQMVERKCGAEVEEMVEMIERNVGREVENVGEEEKVFEAVERNRGTEVLVILARKGVKEKAAGAP